MNWETLYEISKKPFPIEALVAIILCCIVVFQLIQSIKGYSENKRKLQKQIFLHGLVILLLLSFAFIHAVNDNPASVAYYNGQYEVYEGEIENYEKVKSTVIDFEINGETFTWSGIVGLNNVPKEGYVRVYIADYDIVRIDKRVD